MAGSSSGPAPATQLVGPELVPWRPRSGLQPRLSDAELVTLAVMQALLGYASEARWIRQPMLAFPEEPRLAFRRPLAGRGPR